MGGVNLLVPGRGLARGRPDRLVREADHRRRDPPDDVRGAPAAARSTRPLSASMRSRMSVRAATSSARPTRSSGTRRRSTARSCRTGATSRRGRRTARGPRPSAPTRSGSGSWPRRVPPPLDPPDRSPSSTRSSPAASARSRPGPDGAPDWDCQSVTVGRIMSSRNIAFDRRQRHPRHDPWPGIAASGPRSRGCGGPGGTRVVLCRPWYGSRRAPRR